MVILALLGMETSNAQPIVHYETAGDRIVLTRTGASHLAQLPLRCLQQAYPYKTGIVFADASLIRPPATYHPAFYGCFD